MFDPKESEGTKRRHQVDTVVEGMYVDHPRIPLTCPPTLTACVSGINRLTGNLEFALPIIDDAFR